MAGARRQDLLGRLADMGEEAIQKLADAPGADNSVIVVGNFDATVLSPNTITVIDTGGSTTVDVTQLTSAHHVAFHTSGNNDTMIGARPQDEIIADGDDAITGNFEYTPSDIAGGLLLWVLLALAASEPGRSALLRRAAARGRPRRA